MTISDKLRVLMLLENTPYSRDARVPKEAKTLVSAGYKVSVICPGDRRLPRREVLDGVTLYRFPFPPDGDGFLLYLFEYGYAMTAIFIISFIVLVRDGFDVVHAHCPPDTFVLIALFYKLLGKQFIYDHHDLAPELYSAKFGYSAKPFIYRTLVRLEKLSCRYADHIITTNQSYKTIEMQRSKVPESRITVVRNGPDLKRLQPAAQTKNNRKNGKTALCYVGWMGLQDGVDYLLKALHCLINKLGKTDCHCVLVGAGEALSSLKSLAGKLNLTEYVTFTGWVDPGKVVGYLSAADICLAPEPSSEYNDRSTAIKIMEYMAMGKPIVAFDLPEHRFTAEDAAVYASPNNEFDFAFQIANLMDDHEQRERMGRYGRKRAENELAWPYQAKNLLKAYEALLVQ